MIYYVSQKNTAAGDGTKENPLKNASTLMFGAFLHLAESRVLQKCD